MKTQYSGFDLSSSFNREYNCVDYYACCGRYILVHNSEFKNPNSLIGTEGHPYTVKEYMAELKREVDYFDNNRDKFPDAPYDL